jgi:hypothetical protein
MNMNFTIESLLDKSTLFTVTVINSYYRHCQYDCLAFYALQTPLVHKIWVKFNEKVSNDNQTKAKLSSFTL